MHVLSDEEYDELIAIKAQWQRSNERFEAAQARYREMDVCAIVVPNGETLPNPFKEHYRALKWIDISVAVLHDLIRFAKEEAVEEFLTEQRKRKLETLQQNSLQITDWEVYGIPAAIKRNQPVGECPHDNHG